MSFVGEVMLPGINATTNFFFDVLSVEKFGGPALLGGKSGRGGDWRGGWVDVGGGIMFLL